MIEKLDGDLVANAMVSEMQIDMVVELNMWTAIKTSYSVICGLTMGLLYISAIIKHNLQNMMRWKIIKMY